VLVLLDNVRDATQVRPLLPGIPGCLVLLTSRNQLTSLVSADGAVPLNLGVLSTADAYDLLAQRIGADRIAAESAAASSIVERCDGLPLALALAAARAAMQPHLPMTAIAAQLTTDGRSLDALNGGDADTDLRAIFSWSYRTLSPDAARLFRLTGLRAGPTISVNAAASITGIAPDDLTPTLNELTRANLLTEESPGRFATHDLLTTYARELSHRDDHPDDRHQAIGRLIDYYLQTAYTASRHLDPVEPSTNPPAPRPHVRPDGHAGVEGAIDWFIAAHTELVATVHQAATEGLHEHAWQLATALRIYLDRRAHWDDLTAVAEVGLHSARTIGTLTGQAHCLRALGLAALRQDRYPEARTHTETALELSEQAGDHPGQGRAQLTLAWLAENEGRHHDALGHAQQALACYLQTDNQAGQARALGSLAWNHAELGDHEHALAGYEKALAIHQHSGDLDGEATTWEGLGVVHSRNGNRSRAVTCLQNAAGLHGRLGRRHQEAAVLDALGDEYAALGDPPSARQAWRRARSILDELGVEDTEDLQAKLPT
jgi:tetratricopeptide (TPR) repeat protein